MKVYVLMSSGWDPSSTENWGFMYDEDKAEKWVTRVKALCKMWNGCDFDKEIRKKYEEGLNLLGISKKGEFDDAFAGHPWYEELEECDDLV